MVGPPPVMISDDELIERIKETTKDAHRHQLETLHTILENNAGVRYLQNHLRGYPTPTDVETFRRAVPVSCYDDYSDYIHQLADGIVDGDDRTPLLSADPLLCFFYSSGTSSMKPKLIPCFDSTPMKSISYLAHQCSASILRKLFPPRSSVSKVLWFFYAGNVTTTKGGYKAMAATAMPFHAPNSNPAPLISMCVSPKEVLLGSDFEQQMYCHLLCGLRKFDSVDAIRAPYAIGLVRAFNLLESKWEQLCDDIECGFPSLDVSDVPMRDSVAELLGGPQPDLAKRIRSVCGERSWEGILGRLWPNARYVKSVNTGSMEQYYLKLRYYAGELPLLGGDYFASECGIGINLDIMQPPHMTRFVMLPTAAYFEFLPFDLNTGWVTGEGAVTLSNVEIGKMYEVVVTSYRGLYRYRLGDIVKVTGFYNSSPEIEFVMRAPKTSGDIVTEKDLMSAMGRFQLVLKTELMVDIVEFAGFLDLDVIPKRLKIFIEVQKECMLLEKEKYQESFSVLSSSCSSLENALGGIYKVMKGRGELGPLSVSIVKPGSFDKISLVAIKNGATASQYKPPKIIRNHNIVDLLEASAVLTV